MQIREGQPFAILEQGEVLHHLSWFWNLTLEKIKRAMNPTDYENIVQYKVKKEYPPKFTKTDKLLLRRKSHLYEIEGKTNNVITISQM